MADNQKRTIHLDGKHKIFLGYAPGVGKTHAMLEEALRRAKRGQDVVIGLVDSEGACSHRRTRLDLGGHSTTRS